MACASLPEFGVVTLPQGYAKDWEETVDVEPGKNAVVRRRRTVPEALRQVRWLIDQTINSIGRRKSPLLELMT